MSLSCEFGELLGLSDTHHPPACLERYFDRVMDRTGSGRGAGPSGPIYDLTPEVVNLLRVRMKPSK